MSKVLFISGIEIFPPESGGQLRSANLAEALAECGHEVMIYSMTGRKKDYLKLSLSAVKKIRENLFEHTNRNIFFGALQFLAYRLRLPPLWINTILRIFTPLDLKVKMANAEVIIIDFPFLAPIVIDSNHSYILNTHNAEFELYKNLWLQKRVFNIELKAMQNAKKILFCSDSDLIKFSQHYKLVNFKSVIIPNGINTSQYQFNLEKKIQLRKEMGIEEKTNVILFTGSQYGPNKEAFRFLMDFHSANEAWMKENNLCFVIAGSVSDKIQNKDTIKIFGKVPEITPFFAIADFAINPINSGSGTNVKMFEYIAAQLPIFTTPFGARGLKLVDDKSCWLFELDQLKDKLQKILNLSTEEKKRITDLAFEQNRDLIDMKIAVKKVINQII